MSFKYDDLVGTVNQATSAESSDSTQHFTPSPPLYLNSLSLYIYIYAMLNTHTTNKNEFIATKRRSANEIVKGTTITATQNNVAQQRK